MPSREPTWSTSSSRTGSAPDQKIAAREAALEALQEIDWQGREVWVRINSPTSDEARADIEAVVAGGPHAFLIPKVSGPEEIRAVAALLDEAERGNGHGERHIRSPP